MFPLSQEKGHFWGICLKEDFVRKARKEGVICKNQRLPNPKTRNIFSPKIGEFRWCGRNIGIPPDSWEGEGEGSLDGPLTWHTWRHYLETSPYAIAMVIKVKLFTLKPSETIQICTAWLLMHDYVTGGFCLQGWWMNSSTLITMAIGSGPFSR